MTNGVTNALPAKGDTPFQEAPNAKVPLWLQRIDSVIVRTSELLNPILVKEARQALKSRQFIVTFVLLLLFGLGWSVLGVALMSPGVYYMPGGRVMLTGYMLILMIPMIVVVPFSAFRSLAAEREDGTFELLSITSLNSRQIVTGKLGSAILQMIVYYSALAPCIAFTYLLRGIDILTIVLILFYTFLASILLSTLGLLIATISRSRHWQVLLSVTLLIVLLFTDFIASYISIALIWAGGSLEFDEFYFWVFQVAILSFYVSYLILFIWGAAAQISFASDNRSTKIRVILLGQQILLVFWSVYGWIQAGYNQVEVLCAAMIYASIHWYVAGALMSGESAQLSPRVRRALPQTFLGRMLRTWFNPGSGTGYTFVVLNIWSLAILYIGAVITRELIGQAGVAAFTRLATLTTLSAAYVTIYLGFGRLLILGLRQFTTTGLIVPLLLHLVMAALGALIPSMLAGWIQGFGNLEYTSLQMPNWAWTIGRVFYDDLWNWSIVPLSVYTIAGVIFLLNLNLAMHEVEQVRLATPQRVIEDEHQLHPERAPVARRPSSPWDDELPEESTVVN